MCRVSSRTLKCCAEPPATCLRSDTTIEAFTECASNAVVYAAPPGSNSTAATWRALDGVVLDARFLFRGIILARDLNIERVTIAQVLHCCDFPSLV